MSHLVGIIAHPFWFDTVENDWQNLFWKYIPDWFAVKEKDVLRDFFEGDSSFFISQHIKGWLAPMLYWSAFMFVIYFVMICINTIIRKQFEYERLPYPITQLPLEMSRDTPAFFKNKLMWAGFGIAGGINLLNGLSFLYPVIPSIPVWWHDISYLFPERPWNAIGWTLISFQPFIIGLAFFMPLDVTFSSWFFYLLRKLLQVLMSIMGWRTLYFHEQAHGAWIGLGILALWAGRRHLKWVFMQAVTGKQKVDDSKEPMGYRTAFSGMIAGMFFLFFWSYKAGLSLWGILLFFGIYFFIAIGVTKVRASLGPPVHELLWIDPAGAMFPPMGTRVFGGRNLTISSFFFWLNRVNVAHPMPNQLEAFRIGGQANINNRKILLAMIISIAIGIPVSFLLYLSLLYNYGAARSPSHVLGMGREAFAHRLQNWLNYPTEQNYSAMSAMVVAFGITGFLLAMKMRFIWWPFHPIGYVLSTGPAELVYIWCPVLVSWAVKFAILKYGGLRAYRRAIPFFAGLILGDYIMSCNWSIISMIFKITTYRHYH